MDKLTLRYLIREAVEKIANISSKYKIGDKVTTVDGDTATVTMAEHPFYTVELEATGTTKSYNFKDLAPFQEKEIAKTSEGIMLQEGVNASAGLMFHQQHKKPLSECVFRIGSEAYVDFYAEARELFNEGVLNINEGDKYLLRETDIGEYGMFEGKKVPLDIPFIFESHYQVVANLGDKKVKENLDSFEEVQDFMDKVQKRNAISVDVTKVNEDGDSQTIKYDWTGDTWKKVSKSNIKEAEFRGKDVKLNSPKRGGSKAYYVYVKDGDKVKKVSFGSGGLRAKINNPKARQAFAKRHNCDKKKDRTTPGYWSCNLPRYAKQLGLGANKNTFW
jgi:preprotein translocase subunit YajC